MSEIIPVGMGELKVAKSPDVLAVYGVGSCVIISLYDPKTKIGGIVHVMLPDSSGIDKKLLKPNKFADTSVPVLYDRLDAEGVYKSNLVAKLIGGSEMFPPTEDYKSNIGKQNIVAAKNALKKLALPLIAEDTGGNRGRSVEFELETGIMKLSILGEEMKEI